MFALGNLETAFKVVEICFKIAVQSLFDCVSVFIHCEVTGVCFYCFRGEPALF